MENFKENDKNIKELVAIAQELKLLTDSICNVFNRKSEENDFRPSKIPLYKTLFLYLLNIVIKQFSSIHLLCSEGYGECASIILRSMLENLISIKYIILDKESPNAKAERFMDYRWIEMQKYLKYWKMEDEVVNKKVQEQVLSKEKNVISEVDNFKKKFNITYKGQLSTWSGISMENMAQKIGMLGEYNLSYRMCCSFSHASFLGAQQGVVKNKDHTLFSPKPSFEDSVLANIKSAVQYLCEFLVIYDYIFKLGMKQKLDDFQRKARKIFEKT